MLPTNDIDDNDDNEFDVDIDVDEEEDDVQVSHRTLHEDNEHLNNRQFEHSRDLKND